MKHVITLLSILFLPLSVQYALAADTLRILSTRITTYKAIQNNTGWATGAVVSNILFSRYDAQGRSKIDKVITPIGIVKQWKRYQCDKEGRLVEEVRYSTNIVEGRSYRYVYDTQGRIDTLASDLPPVLDPEGLNEEKRVDLTYDAFGNWVKRVEYNQANPEFIAVRDIEYEGLETDRDRLPLSGQVQSVFQTSYVAVSKGPETIMRGRKQGNFFRYTYNPKGMKVIEESYSQTGVRLATIQYVYDEQGRLLKEITQPADGSPGAIVVWKYDTDGILKSKLRLNPQEEVMRKGIFHYDFEGNCISETWFNKDGSKFSEFRYVYDPYGQRLSKETLVQAEEDAGNHAETYTWNFQKRVAQERIQPTRENRVLVRTYKYNAKGEVISGTEQVGEEPAVPFVYKFFNDERGNWRKRIKFVNNLPVVYEEREYMYN